MIPRRWYFYWNGGPEIGTPWFTVAFCVRKRMDLAGSATPTGDDDG